MNKTFPIITVLALVMTPVAIALVDGGSASVEAAAPLAKAQPEVSIVAAAPEAPSPPVAPCGRTVRVLYAGYGEPVHASCGPMLTR